MIANSSAAAEDHRSGQLYREPIGCLCAKPRSWRPHLPPRLAGQSVLKFFDFERLSLISNSCRHA